MTNKELKNRFLKVINEYDLAAAKIEQTVGRPTECSSQLRNLSAFATHLLKKVSPAAFKLLKDSDFLY